MKTKPTTSGKSRILRRPEDETGSAGDDSQETRKRKQVSKRSYLNADGSEAERLESASGGRYTLLGAANGDHDYQFGENPDFDRMCAIFGFHTKIGNVANTVLNDKDEPGTPDDAGAAIQEFIAAAKSGTWAERAAGVGARIDKDALAGAIIEVAKASGHTAEYSAIRQRLEDDPQYVRAARQVPDVANAYAARVGKATKTIDSLLA